MGKAGRFACIFVPMALSIASLVCLILVLLGGWNQSSSTLNNLYFFKADTSNITSNSTSAIDNALLKTGLEAARASNNLADFYHVNFWNYCSGNKTGNGSETVTLCSPRQQYFWFNPVDVWNLNGTGVEQLFPKELSNGLATYQKVAKWMYIAYVAAFWVTIGEIFFGIFAIFSRWGSFITTFVSIASSILVIAASLTATLLYSTLTGTFNTVLKDYGIHGSLGKSMYVATWLAVAFSLAAGLFWLFSVCFCSGKSGQKTVKVEKTPYTYERVGSPYNGQSANRQGQQQHQMPLHDFGVANKGGYEPYRHDSRV